MNDDDEYLAALFADEDDDEVDADESPVHAVTFPAFEPHRRYGKKFADTWWGNAWTESMEDTALDREQLRRGRAHAFAGYVGPITVSQGRVSATVHDGDHTHPFTTVVRVSELTDAGWDRFLDQAARRAGHVAALLDRDMPRELVSAAADAGVRLLPDFDDLEPECTCPEWNSPCAHAAALAYQVSWLLDRDPFVLLLVRGRDETDLMAELHRRNSRAGATRAATVRVGVSAVEAWAAEPAPLPEPPGPLLVPARPLAPLLADVEMVSPVVDDALVVLAADAASRAADLLAGGGWVVADQWSDAVRLAIRAQDVLDEAAAAVVVESAAAASGRPDEFTAAASYPVRQ
ncbi:SWIM zinc finger family protein [Actinokineospora terrae]|uniref:Uncharacterized conserved protein, contains Zn finger domain n=1 Tax=Actinokineospora terrae TaxID=155974 RepID=A0A1H9MVK7_9PSEU|nr:SWIM zinc finger family protein [Actinokineospora terrae]SER27509.1 Uncharacterized conserved protein, contains Zn finger domain [Actinokineospora terrae]